MNNIKKQNHKSSINHEVKTTHLAIFIALFAIFGVTNDLKADSTNNSPTAAFLGALQNLAEFTNVAVLPYGETLVSGSEKGKWGGGVRAYYNVADYAGLGVGFDYLGHWTEVSGKVQLQIPMQNVFFGTNLCITPYAFTGIGTPMSGSGSDTGDASTISETGINFDIHNINIGNSKDWMFSFGGGFGSITGAGTYSGNIVNMFLEFRHGF